MSTSDQLNHEEYVLQIANNIRYYCDTRGVSYTELENSAGVNQGYVSRIISHPDTKVRLWTILQFASAMNIDASKLIFTDISAKERQLSIERIRQLLERLETEQESSLKTIEKVEKALQEPDKTSLYKAEKELKKVLDKIKKDKEKKEPD